MAETGLSEALHERLDRMGAPPRPPAPAASPAPPETVDDAALGVNGELGQPVETPPAPPAAAETETPPGEIPHGEDEDGNTPAAGATDAGEIPQTYKPAELAQAIGWEPEELYNDLRVPIGDSGETLSLGEMKDQYEQLAAGRAEVEQARQAIATQAQQMQQQLLQGPQAVSQEMQAAHRKLGQIEAQYGQVNWEELDKSDPGQAANLRQRFGTAYAAAENELNNAKQQFQAQQQQAAQALIVEQDRKLVELIPEWKDLERAKTEQEEVHHYLTQQMGFAPQELQSIVDARARAVARDAMLWRKHMAKVSKEKGKFREAPKPVLRHGGGGEQRQAAQDQETARLVDNARQTGTRQDKLAAARAIVFSEQRKKRR